MKCKCGCGQEVKEGKRYICGHQNREQSVRARISKAKTRHPVSKETRKKLSDAIRNLSDEKRQSKSRKIRLALVGRKLSEEHKRKIGDAEKGEKHHLYGKHHTEETKRKISEANTGKKHPNYGKHLSKETRKKIGEANSGRTPWNKGKTGIYSEEARREMSKANRGEKHHFFGKHLSEEHKKKIGDAERGEKSHSYGKHLSEATKQKIRDARRHQKIPKHHTKPELIFEEICKNNSLPFKYTGDGSFWVGEKPAINPDFIHLTKKIAVEVYGDYWHSPLLRPDMSKIQHPIYRAKILKKYGWNLIVFWEADLLREDAEEIVLGMMKKKKISSVPPSQLGSLENKTCDNRTIT